MKAETVTLWQRCEALGPINDDHMRIRKTSRWIIEHDGHAIIYIYDTKHGGFYEEGGVRGSAWLADLILQRFEALAAPKVVEPKSFWDQYLKNPHAKPPQETIKALFEYLDEMQQPQGESIGIIVRKSMRESSPRVKERTIEVYLVGETLGVTLDRCNPFMRVIDRGCSYHVDHRGTFAYACKWIKFDPEPNTYTFSGGPKEWKEFQAKLPVAPSPTTLPTQDQIKGLFHFCNDRARGEANGFGFRCRVDEMCFSLIVWEANPCAASTWRFDIFRSAELVYAFDSKLSFSEACKRVGFDPIVIPDTLDTMEVKYVVGSPSEFVSIPVGEWKMMQQIVASIQSATKDVDSLAVMLRAVNLTNPESPTNLQP